MEQKLYDVAIIGGGPGGYTAGLYCARSGFSVVVLEKLSPGGQMATTGQVDNYPGFEGGVDGFELGEKMQRGAERFGVETRFAEVTGVELAAVPKVIQTSEGRCGPELWCWPPGPLHGRWDCPGSRSCGAGGWRTAPPATA